MGLTGTALKVGTFRIMLVRVATPRPLVIPRPRPPRDPRPLTGNAWNAACVRGAEIKYIRHHYILS